MISQVRSNQIFASYKTRPAVRYNSSLGAHRPRRLAPHSGIFTSIAAMLKRSYYLKKMRNSP